MQQVVIALEGGEGVGKSIQSRRVVATLKERGIPALWTREPGGSPGAERIRELIFGEMGEENAETMFGLFWAARASHVAKIILPALQRREVVISDRLDGSTLAYQLFGQEQRQLELLFWEMRAHYLKPILPHLSYLWFDADPAIGLARVASRGGEVTHFDLQQLPFHERIREGYSKFFSNIEQPYFVVDASLSQDEVFGRALECVMHVVQSNNPPQ